MNSRIRFSKVQTTTLSKKPESDQQTDLTQLLQTKQYDKAYELLKPDISKIIKTYAPQADPVIAAKAKLYTFEAMKSFDPKRNVKFRTYLYTQLQKLKQDAAQSTAPLVTPYKRWIQAKQYEEAYQKFVDLYKREPTVEEMADKLGTSPRVIRNIQKSIIKVGPESLVTGEEGEESELEAGIKYEPNVDAVIEAAKQELNPVNQKILEMARQGKSLNEIARKLKLTPAAVSYRAEQIRRILGETYGIFTG